MATVREAIDRMGVVAAVEAGLAGAVVVAVAQEVVEIVAVAVEAAEIAAIAR
jgi:hypothetical protein